MQRQANSESDACIGLLLLQPFACSTTYTEENVSAIKCNNREKHKFCMLHFR